MLRTKESFIIVIITAIFYALTCIPFYVAIKQAQRASKDSDLDLNTIRSIYPNYSHLLPSEAKQIFLDYAAPKSEYQPFTGYRRKPYAGKFVNIDQNGYRLSLLHDSRSADAVFLGGSTMWGTGASDDETIPSFFSRLSGLRVANLGESGFLSNQELNAVLKYLLNAESDPAYVVFYDGVNDGYYSCQKDEVPTHAYTARYRKMIEGYADMEKKLNTKLHEIIETTSLADILLSRFHALRLVTEFLASPYIYYSRSTNQGTGQDILNYERDKKILDFKKGGDPLNCNDPLIAEKAARNLVNIWLLCYEFLTSRGIKPVFVLQPTSQSHDLAELNIDYIINSKKQFIVDTKGSYMAFYAEVRKQWRDKCERLKSCDSFIDLSEVFSRIAEPVFIDECHVGANGNRLVAQKIHDFISKKTLSMLGGRLH